MTLTPKVVCFYVTAAMLEHDNRRFLISFYLREIYGLLRFVYLLADLRIRLARASTPLELNIFLCILLSVRSTEKSVRRAPMNDKQTNKSSYHER